MTYSEKLKDPRWQKKRLEILERDGWECRHCADKKNTLNVHHVNYEKGKAPWEYGQDNFITLCANCHDLLERRIRVFRTSLAVSPAGSDGSMVTHDLLTFHSALFAEGPFNSFAKEATEKFADALRRGEEAVMCFANGETSEGRCEVVEMMALAAAALVNLHSYVCEEAERLQKIQPKGGMA